MLRHLASLALLALAPLPGRAHPGAGMVVDAQGQVFFVQGNRIVRVATNGHAQVFLEDPTHQNFFQLHHLFLDDRQNLYTAADSGGAVWKISPQGQLSRFFPPPNEDRNVRVGLGGDPFAIDPAGHLLAVNSQQHQFTQLLRLTPQGQITLLAGGAWGHADGRAGQARFRDLHGGAMAFGSNGVFFLTDDGCSLRKITGDGTVSTLAGGTNRAFADGPSAVARFDGVCGLTLDAAGNVYSADSGNHRIRKTTPRGVTTTLAGSGRAGSTDGLAAEAAFTHPTGVAFGPDGVLYVLDHDGRIVRKISTSGQVTTILRPLLGE